MKTNLIYYQHPYQTNIQTTINSINLLDDGSYHLTLRDSIFYPEGGGQPGDKGYLAAHSYQLDLKHQKWQDGQLIYICTSNDARKSPEQGDQVDCQLDWDWRYKYMKIHTAGHLIHDVLMNTTDKLTPMKAGHGKKAYIEYNGTDDELDKDQIEKQLTQAIAEDLAVNTGSSTAEELQTKCRFIPSNLPKNKPLRFIQIGSFPPMPDGGVHVKSTKELGKIRITSIQNSDNKTKITYQVINMKT